MLPQTRQIQRFVVEEHEAHVESRPGVVNGSGVAEVAEVEGWEVRRFWE